ncbi:hypothetical protein Tco_0243010 [Tanacetum coccineum]
MAQLEFCDKHNLVAYLVKSESSKGFDEIIDFLTSSHIYYALTENPIIFVSLIKICWETAILSTTEEGLQAISTTIDGREKLITEDSLRRYLKLDDAEGISSLSNEEIFEHLAHIGYVTNSESLTFFKGHFSPQWKFFIHTILHCLSSKKTAWDQFSSNIATALICLATSRRFIQLLLNKQQRLLLPHTRTYSTPTLTSKLFSNMRRASKGIDGLERDLQQTKKTYSTALTKLVLRVKKLEYKLKSGKARRKAKIEEEVHEKLSDGTEVLVQEENPTKIIKEHGSGEKGEMEISTANIQVSTVSPPKVSTAVVPHVYTRGGKDKGKPYGKNCYSNKKVKPRELKCRSDVEKDSSNPVKEKLKNSRRRGRFKERTFKEDRREKKETDDYEEEKDKLRMWLTVVPDEEAIVDPEVLHTKFPIVDWESQSLGNMHVYKIIRADGNTNYHKTFESMLKSFDRHDLEGDLKILVDPEQDDDIWKNQNQWKITSCKLYEKVSTHRRNTSEDA